MYDAHVPQSELSVLGERPARHALGLRPDGHRDRGRTGANIDARLAAFPDALAGVRTTLVGSADAGYVAAQRQIHAVADQIRHWTGQKGTGGDFFAHLVADADVSRRRSPRTCRGTPPRPATPPPRSAGSSTRSSARAAARSTPAGASATRWARATSSAPRSTWRRPTPGAGRSSPASRTTMARGRRQDRARRHGRRRGRRARRRPVAPHRRASRSSRPGCSGSPTASSTRWPACTSTSPSRSAGSSAASRPTERRRHLLHRPERGLPPPGPDVVGGARRHRRRSRRGARSRPSSTRASRATTSRSAQTAYRSELLNRWQRLMCWVSGHGEGWALYAERLMDELGYLDDPADKLGMLDAQSFRAARVDRRHRHAPAARDPAGQPVRLPPRRDLGPRPRPGVHAPALPHGGRPDQVRGEPLPRLARARRRRTRSASASGCRPATTRGPGSATRFDLKAFHRAALDLGSIGLDPLQAALARISMSARTRPCVLASASPARLATLRSAGVEPRVLVSGVDESQVDRAGPGDARRTAGRAQGRGRRRAARGRRPATATACVLGCDSVLELDGRVLGKPDDADDARARWRSMRGRSGRAAHRPLPVDLAPAAGWSARSTRWCTSPTCPTTEIEAYVASGEPLHVAGAFTIDGLGGAFVRGHRGRPALRGRGQPAALRRDGDRARPPLDRSVGPGPLSRASGRLPRMRGIILAGGTGHAAAPDHPRRQQAARAGLRQADDLLPAVAR